MRIALTSITTAAFLAATLTPALSAREGETRAEFEIREGLDRIDAELSVKPNSKSLIVKKQELRRRALVKVITEAIAELKAERKAIQEAVAQSDNLQERRELWADFKSYRGRIAALYEQIQVVRFAGFGDVEELEDFYSDPVSVA